MPDQQVAPEIVTGLRAAVLRSHGACVGEAEPSLRFVLGLRSDLREPLCDRGSRWAHVEAGDRLARRRRERLAVRPLAVLVLRADPHLVVGGLLEEVHHRLSPGRAADEERFLADRSEMDAIRVRVLRGRPADLQSRCRGPDQLEPVHRARCAAGAADDDVSGDPQAELRCPECHQPRHLDRPVLLEVGVVRDSVRPVRVHPGVGVQEYVLGTLRTELVEERSTARGEIDQRRIELGSDRDRCLDVLREADPESSGVGVDIASAHRGDHDRLAAPLPGPFDVGAQILAEVLGRRVPVGNRIGRIVVAELHVDVVARAHQTEHLVQPSLVDEAAGGTPTDGAVVDEDPVADEAIEELAPAGLGHPVRVVGLHRGVAQQVQGGSMSASASGKGLDVHGVDVRGGPRQREAQPTGDEGELELELEHLPGFGFGLRDLLDLLGGDGDVGGPVQVSREDPDPVVPRREVHQKGRCARGGDEVAAQRVLSPTVRLGQRRSVLESVSEIRRVGGLRCDLSGSSSDLSRAEVEAPGAGLPGHSVHVRDGSAGDAEHRGAEGGGSHPRQDGAPRELGGVRGLRRGDL